METGAYLKALHIPEVLKGAGCAVILEPLVGRSNPAQPMK